MPPDADPADMMLRKARDDLVVLAKMIDTGGYPVEIVGFHAQQSCEKSFKAVLTRNGVRYPHTHDLLALVDLLRDSLITVPELVEETPALTPFAVVYRYEDLDLDDAPDLDELLALVTHVHQWAVALVHPRQTD